MKKVRWLSAAAGTAIVAFSLAMPTAAYAASGPSGDTSGAGNLSLLNGNGINLPVSIPVDLCGVAVGILGSAEGGCQGGASTSTTVVSDGAGGGGGSDSGNTTGIGNISAVNGNNINAPVSVPISACGVSGAVGGAASSHCKGGSSTDTTVVSGGGADGDSGNTTGIGNIAAANGNTINAPVSVPVSVCSVSLAILGDAESGCRGGATTTTTITPPPPTCHGRDCTPAPPGCRGLNCAPPVCHGTHCAPPRCTGNNCTVTPPGGGTHRHPGGSIPGITTSGGSNSGGGNVNGSASTTVTAATTASTMGSLPTTGADLAVVAAAALGSIAVGTGAVVFARRRRNIRVSQAEVSPVA